MHSFGVLVLVALVSLVPIECAEEAKDKNVAKRSSILYADEYFTNPLIATAPKVTQLPVAAPWLPHQRSVAPSPGEVSNYIASAKQASANVLIAQQQVQAAKENVLNQQRVAMDKEANAALLTQKSEAAAAIQRSEAAAAAQAVILAQQRLAAAKAAVAHQQRIAAAKEAEAASALQSAAQAAAAEIHRTEAEAAKYATIHRNGAATIAHHVTATKDAIVSPLSSGNNNIPNFAFPWHSTAGFAAPWANAGLASSGHVFIPSKVTFPSGHYWG